MSVSVFIKRFERTTRRVRVFCQRVGGNRCNVCLEEHRSGLFADDRNRCENAHVTGQAYLVEEIVRTTIESQSGIRRPLGTSSSSARGVLMPETAPREPKVPRKDLMVCDRDGIRCTVCMANGYATVFDDGDSMCGMGHILGVRYEITPGHPTHGL